MKTPVSIIQRLPIVVAHRGASAYKRENSIEAFEEAINQKADMIEFDLRMTADEKIVLYHDPYVISKGGKKVVIARTCLDELQSIAKEQNYEIAQFEEVLKLFGHRIRMNIEVKMFGFEKRILKLLSEYNINSNPVISSFKSRVIDNFRELDKNIMLGFIMGKSPANLLNLIKKPILLKFLHAKTISSVHFHIDIANERIIKKLTAGGFSVYIWTVDDTDDYRKLINYGVNGIITNKPDKLRNTLEDLS